MIIAVASGDAATSSNHAVCIDLLAQSSTCLSGTDVQRTRLLAILNEHGSINLLFVGHGSEIACIGSDGNQAIHTRDVALLASRKTFAMACHTAGGLGVQVAAAGGTWIGFVGAINCLPSDEDIIELFKKIPVFIVRNLASVNDDFSSQLFLNRFCDLLKSIVYDLDRLEIASLEPYAALDVYKRRLRIWLAGASTPEASFEADQPSTRF